jgi:endothelin-converting enzyme
MVPEISIIKYLREIAPEGYPITPDRTVILRDMDYFAGLSALIRQTPRDTIHLYFRSRLIVTWIGFLHNSLNLPLKQQLNMLLGKDPNSRADRSKLCTVEMDNALPHILGGTFVERMFKTKDKELGDRIIGDIKTVFNERLKHLEWMPTNIQELAATKGMH